MAKSSKVNICPNCGANNSNNEVCEYCGSRIPIESKQSKTTTKKIGKEEEKEEEEKRKLQEFIDKYPLLGAMIIKRYQYIKVKFDEREKALNGNIVPRTGVNVKEIKAALGNCHLEIWNANDTNCKFSVHVTPKDWKQNMNDILYRNAWSIAIYVAAENGSDELEKIYAANLPRFKILQTADLINHAQNRCVDCLINCSKYTVFYRDECCDYKRYLMFAEEAALILIDIFKALGIDEHNLRYHYWFTNDRTIDDYFDAEGNLMETKPELPSLRIFGHANETSLAQHTENENTENENVSVWIYVVWFIMTGGSIIYGCVAIYEDWASVKEIIMFILGIIGLVVGLKAIAKNSNE